MISICKINDFDLQQYDEAWYCVNFVHGQKVGTEHHPELAPNRDDYLKYRQGQISLQEMLRNYENDLRTSKLPYLNQLVQLSEQGKWIQCGCYCEDYTNCHRYVMYKVLKEMTDDVVLSS